MAKGNLLDEITPPHPLTPTQMLIRITPKGVAQQLLSPVILIIGIIATAAALTLETGSATSSMGTLMGEETCTCNHRGVLGR